MAISRPQPSTAFVKAAENGSMRCDAVIEFGKIEEVNGHRQFVAYESKKRLHKKDIVQFTVSQDVGDSGRPYFGTATASQLSAQVLSKSLPKGWADKGWWMRVGVGYFVNKVSYEDGVAKVGESTYSDGVLSVVHAEYSEFTRTIEIGAYEYLWLGVFKVDRNSISDSKLVTSFSAYDPLYYLSGNMEDIASSDQYPRRLDALRGRVDVAVQTSGFDFLSVDGDDVQDRSRSNDTYQYGFLFPDGSFHEAISDLAFMYGTHVRCLEESGRIALMYFRDKTSSFKIKRGMYSASGFALSSNYISKVACVSCEMDTSCVFSGSGKYQDVKRRSFDRLFTWLPSNVKVEKDGGAYCIEMPKDMVRTLDDSTVLFEESSKGYSWQDDKCTRPSDYAGRDIKALSPNWDYAMKLMPYQLNDDGQKVYNGAYYGYELTVMGMPHIPIGSWVTIEDAIDTDEEGNRISYKVPVCSKAVTFNGAIMTRISAESASFDNENVDVSNGSYTKVFTNRSSDLRRQVRDIRVAMNDSGNYSTASLMSAE